MEQYPGGPREEKPSTAWRFVVGCGAVVLVMLIAGGVACGLVCRHLTARATVSKDKAVLTGQENGHAWLYVTESDPGMVAIRRHLEERFERVAEEASRPGTKTRLEGGAIFLPLRLQVRTYPPAAAGGAPVMVGEVELSGGYNIFRGFLRFMGRERRDALGNGASLYRFPQDEGEVSLGVAGNRFVASRTRVAVVPLVDGSHRARSPEASARAGASGRCGPPAHRGRGCLGHGECRREPGLDALRCPVRGPGQRRQGRLPRGLRPARSRLPRRRARCVWRIGCASASPRD